MIETALTRKPRRLPSVDVALFAGDVADAIAAFGRDVTYAVSMARAAVAIEHKRRSWDARKRLRQAEAAAHAECEQHDFTCHAVAACGTGDCKFAQDELAGLTVAAPGGKSRRPQPPHESYGMDEAVAALTSRRQP